MGIFCEINLFKPSNEVYRPGQVLSGLIKYAIDKPTEFEKITTSFKGNGYVKLTVHNDKDYDSYTSKEVYIDVDNVIQEDKINLDVGSYEVKFNYIIPHNIPSTVKTKLSFYDYEVKCEIKYYVRIKFERSGFLAFGKHFKKEINVISGVIPRLCMEPVAYEESKKLMRLFSSKNSAVNVKATILNSVLPVGGKVQIQYEVNNLSSIVVKSVEIKLVEVYKFNAKGHREVCRKKEVMNTDVQTTSINRGESQTMPLEIDIPPHLFSLESSMVSRDYIVRIIARLPIPHRNLVLDIPVQIGAMIEEINQISDDFNYEEPPPTYWEAMGEMKKSDDDGSDDDTDFTKVKK